MRKTELTHWVDGYQVRGGVKNYAFHIGKLGVMIFNFSPFIEFFILI